MTIALGLVIFIIFIAFVFDYTNGFHDAANSIATVVSTRVLSPGMAVTWAAFFNFVAFAILGTRVAKTIGGDLVRIELVAQDMRLYMLLAGLIGAIVWNLITWYVGLPTSSSHALIGGYGGAAIAAYGSFLGILKPEGWTKTIIFIVASPLIGMTLGFFSMVAVHWIFRRSSAHSVDRIFRKGQFGFRRLCIRWVTAATMRRKRWASSRPSGRRRNTWGGPGGKLPEIPLWVVLSAHGAIALGTSPAAGAIVHTMGSKITKLKPVGGFCAETSGALALFGATLAGIPVSTTHTITGAIVGVGSTRRLSAVKWGVARRIVWAWVLTIPMAGTIAAISFLIIRALHQVAN